MRGSPKRQIKPPAIAATKPSPSSSPSALATTQRHHSNRKLRVIGLGNTNGCCVRGLLSPSVPLAGEGSLSACWQAYNSKTKAARAGCNSGVPNGLSSEFLVNPGSAMLTSVSIVTFSTISFESQKKADNKNPHRRCDKGGTGALHALENQLRGEHPQQSEEHNKPTHERYHD